MRVVVTGGTGLIGSALSERLVKAGHEVVVLSRTPGRHAPRPGVRTVGWDGRTTEGWASLVDGAGAVVNLAGAGLADQRWNASRKAELIASRVDAGRAVAAAVSAAHQPPAVVVQASAIGYYGPRGDELLDESEQPGTDFLAQLCRAWEESSASVSHVDARRLVVRMGLVLTPKSGPLGKQLPLFRMGLGARVGSGLQWMSWIHLADVVAALEFLIGNEAMSGPVNVVAPTAVTNAEFTRQVGAVLRRPAPWVVPAPALRLLVGELAESLLTGQRVVPTRLTAAGFGFAYPELGPALRQLLG